MRSREFCPDLGHLKYQKSVLEPKTLVSTWFVIWITKQKECSVLKVLHRNEKKKESNDCKGNTFCAHKKISDNAP